MDVRISNDKEAIQYLLGELSDAEQAQLEERFFQDAELSELLSEVEDDLIDQYVRKELSERQRQRFEDHFLISERRREKVEFASALLQAENATKASETRDSQVTNIERSLSWWRGLASLYSPPPAFAYSMAAVALLFLLGGLWLFSEVRDLRREVARMEAERRLLEQQEEQLRNQAMEHNRRSEELAAQNERLEQELALLKQQENGSDTETSGSPSMLAFILSPGSRSSEGPKNLTIPRSVHTIRLQLNLIEGDQYGSYQVNLQTASGQIVRSWDRLRGTSAVGRRVVYVNVPARQLHAGQYELRLSGVDAPDRVDDLGYYYFNLLKE